MKTLSIALNTYKEALRNKFLYGAFFLIVLVFCVAAFLGSVSIGSRKDVILDFGNGTKRPMVAYDDGIFIDTIHLMSELHSYLKKHNVIFEEHHVTSFSELLPYQFIFNCSGLGSVALNNDQKMVSVQGHLIMLKDQNPQDIQYIILNHFNDEITASGQKITRSFYLIPKQIQRSNPRDIGVIGGTFIEGATSKTPNREEFATIVENAKKFYGIEK